jgi:hypothetical protein
MSEILDQDLLYQLCTQMKKDILKYVNEKKDSKTINNITKYHFILYTCIYVFKENDKYNPELFKKLIELLKEYTYYSSDIFSYFFYYMQVNFNDDLYLIRINRFIEICNIIGEGKIKDKYLISEFLEKEGNIKNFLYNIGIYNNFSVDDKNFKIRINRVGVSQTNQIIQLSNLYYSNFIVKIIKSYYVNINEENGYEFVKSELKKNFSTNINDNKRKFEILSGVYPYFYFISKLSRDITYNCDSDIDIIIYFDEHGERHTIAYKNNYDIKKGAIKHISFIINDQIYDEKNVIKKTVIDFNVYYKKKNTFFYVIDAYFKNISLILGMNNTNINNYIYENDRHLEESFYLLINYYSDKNKNFIINNNDTEVKSIFEYMLDKYSEIKDELINFGTIHSDIEIEEVFNFMVDNLFKYFYDRLFFKQKYYPVLNKIKFDSSDSLTTILTKYKKKINYHKFYINSLFNYEFILFILKNITPSVSSYNPQEGIINLYPLNITYSCVIPRKNTTKNGSRYDLNKKKFFTYHVIFDSQVGDKIFERIINDPEPAKLIKDTVIIMNLVKIYDDEIIFYGTKFIMFIDDKRYNFNEGNIVKIFPNTKYINIFIGSNSFEIPDDREFNNDKLLSFSTVDDIPIGSNISLTHIIISIDKNIDGEELHGFGISDKENYEKIIVDMIFLKTCKDMNYNYGKIKQKYETFILYDFDVFFDELDEHYNTFIDNFINSEIFDFEDVKIQKYIDLYNSFSSIDLYNNYTQIYKNQFLFTIDYVKHKKIIEYNKKLEEYKINKSTFLSSYVIKKQIKSEKTSSKFEIKIESDKDKQIFEKIKKRFTSEVKSFIKGNYVIYNEYTSYLYPYILYGLGVINKHFSINKIGYLIIHGGSAIKFYNDEYPANDVDVKFFPYDASMTEDAQRDLLLEYYNLLIQFLNNIEIKYSHSKTKISATKKESKSLITISSHSHLFQDEVKQPPPTLQTRIPYFNFVIEIIKNKIIKLKLSYPNHTIPQTSIFETYLFNKRDSYFELYNEILKTRKFTISDATEIQIPDATKYEDTGLVFLNKELLIIELLFKIFSPDKIIVSDETGEDKIESLYNFIQGKAKYQLKTLINNIDLDSLLLAKGYGIQDVADEILRMIKDGMRKLKRRSIRKSKRRSIRKSKRKSKRRSIRKSKRRSIRKSMRKSMRKKL